MEQGPQNDPQGFKRLAGAVESLVKQERWTRRFANLLKLAVAGYIVFFIYTAIQNMNRFDEMNTTSSNQEHAAIVKLEGPIMPGSKVSAEVLNPLLQKAFSNPASKAVIIQANSPGGSPVQSALINDEITRLKKKYNKPVYVVVEDLCASGCYYIAVAADKIFANKGSIVGSIGVRMDSFGFTGLMEKIGIENRSMHAGEHKTFINPFAPVDEEGRKFFKERVLERTHQQFIAAVRAGRGDRIKENDLTYTGLVWLGDEAVENGLIDGLGDMGSVQRDVIGVSHRRVYEAEKSLFEELMGDISSETSTKLSMYLMSLK
ncbi:S49 family peptidase [Thiomicrorhabdus sp. ZW0627]|uniref:S49 family peptidase n=1 Tax=Thiomicrorhabdus sp. ZW0627 TaxID=3039774 RepID=UPI002436DBDE|nr:S49 family peptidase [Thiomicrorhabdus sp. ZW0627]MDG6773071.1 S49 family peptidase [Thiomicrorhabdus sp. ZW0627]